MTAPQPPEERASCIALPGSRLEALLASYEVLKAAAEEAAGQFRAVTDAIKAEAAAGTGATSIAISGAPGLPRLRMTWRESWRLDSKLLKETDPATYARYAVKSGSWELRQSQ